MANSPRPDQAAPEPEVRAKPRAPVGHAAKVRASVTRLGAIHHTFAAGENELIVVDEWDTAESFQAFFNGNPKVEKVTADIGVQGPPTVEVFEKGRQPAPSKSGQGRPALETASRREHTAGSPE